MAEDDQVVTAEGADAEPAAAQDDGKLKLDMTMNVEDIGPCRKHIRINVARASLDEVYDELVDDYMDKAEVPGFRVGRVPADLVKKRFREELSEKVKQRVLMASLEQVGDESKLDPITEPNLDLDAIEIPDEGDFEFEFDIEVRPEFDLPNYKGLKIKRPARVISDEDVDAYLANFREQYGKLVPVDAPAEAGDFVIVDVTTSHEGKVLTKLEELSIRVRPKVRFQDVEVAGFDKLMVGAQAGDTRETQSIVSMESDNLELRNDPVQLVFQVLDVKRLEVPPLDAAFLGRVGADDEESLGEQIRRMLDRQVKYEQRQACREQVLDQIADSANWELPEELLKKQVENAMRREMLELQQSGFSTREILARENELRQQSLTMTSKNLKQHFVLDKIVEAEEITVTSDDINGEIAVMALQSGENPRRVRARLAKGGMLENLEAQIRERKAVDVILQAAEFTDVPMPAPVEREVEAVNRSVCRTVSAADVDGGEADDEE